MAKILVVDDHLTLAQMLRDILEEEGHSVTTVHTGHEGVQIFTRESFDLVIQDVNLPGGVSGYGACQSYKSIRDDVAVIMMSGEFISDQDEALARRLGADGFLRKPIARQQLLQQVSRALEERARLIGQLPLSTCQVCGARVPVQDPLPHEGSFRLACPNCGRVAEVTKTDLVWEKPEERKGPQGPGTRRILVVQDNAPFRHFLAFLLKGAGNLVLEAQNGREGLEFSRAWNPHLVIADVMLPELDGITMSQKIKEDPKTAKILVMILTSFQSDASQQQAKTLGAAYLAKPIRPEALVETVNRTLSRQS